MSNMRFNTVSTHPSKKWDMRLAHAIFLWRKITSIVDLCVIAALFLFHPSGEVVHTSRGAWKFASITQQVSLFWHRLLCPCCSLTVLYTRRVSTRNSFASLRNRLFRLFFRRTDMNHFAIDVCFLSFAMSTFFSLSLMFWKLLAITENRLGLFVFFCFCFFRLRVLLCDPKGSFTPHASPLFGNLMRDTTASFFRSGCCSSVVPSVTTSDAESEKKRPEI